jgi:pyrimidine deaminase RibD-like protein
MLILATKLKNRFTAGHTCTLRNIRVNAEKRGCSGFIELQGAIVYVNTEPCGSLGYMYRTAQHLKDYTGGRNHWARDLDSLVKGVGEMLQAQIIVARAGVPADRLIVSHIGA